MAARQTGMRLQKFHFSFWFNLKKIARTSVAIGLLVLGLVATLSYIQVETASLKNSESVVQITDRNLMVNAILWETSAYRDLATGDNESFAEMY